MVKLPAHTDKSFDEELAALRRGVLEMGAQAAGMTAQAARLLTANDPEGVEAVLAADRALDALRESLDERAVLVIARRQPVANDLRSLVAVLRISAALERVGDLAKNVAKRSAALSGAAAPGDAVSAVRRMGDRARAGVEAAMGAYADLDPSRAEAVWREDADLDAMLSSLFRELLTHMAESPRAIGACTHLMFCAKNMERIGDHATTVAEAVNYIVTGHAFEGERPKISSVVTETD